MVAELMGSDFDPQLGEMAEALQKEIADPELLSFLREAFNTESAEGDLSGLILNPVKLSDQERNAIIVFGMEAFAGQENDMVLYSAAFQAGLIWGRKAELNG